jgi:hypothetical protein
MPATFGVDSTFGLTAPSGYLQSSEETVEIEIATIKNQIGRVVEAINKPRSTTTVNVKTKGSAALSSVSSGSDFTGLTVTSSKYSQTNDDFSTSEVTGILYQ